MRSTIGQMTILIALWCFVLIAIPNVGASNVTYSDEYYILTNNANIIFNKCDVNANEPMYGNWIWSIQCATSSFYHLTSQRERAIQIALEKQNELISEQNEKLDRLLEVKNVSIECSYLIKPTTTVFGVKK